MYISSKYDPERDPFADVAAAVTKAQAENKRILLIAGGDWCIWCEILATFMHNTEAVTNLLTKNYIIVKVNVSKENENKKFLTQYPEIPGYPHIFVLDADGTSLHTQDMLELEIGKNYDEVKFVEFLEMWRLEE
ncbi:MAG: thioredoxin family protein [Chloroflexi bacterium]|nr:MAG: thioredoxin family protein [Chloroflexota bacterium]